MAVTQADIDTLNQAIADGVRQVTLPGGQVTIFQTTESLIKARDDMRAEMQRAQAVADGRRKNRRTLLSFAGRGYQ
jgi:hypothetical protein